MIDWKKDYSAVEHPDWVGLRHKMSQEIEETRDYGVEVFI